MRQVTLQSSNTNVTVSDGFEEQRFLYEISCDNFSLSISVAPANNHDVSKNSLMDLGVALAAETGLVNIQKIIKDHLQGIAVLELAVIFSTATTNHYFLTGRFYRKAEEKVLNEPTIITTDTPNFMPLNQKKLPDWQMDKESKGSIGYVKNSAAYQTAQHRIIDAELKDVTTQLMPVVSNAHKTVKPLSAAAKPPFPVKTFAAGGAISALGAVALVMTLTAKYAGSHAVVSLVGMKAMNLFWPIALGVGSTLVLGSLYHYAKQRGLFSSCPGIPCLPATNAAKLKL